MMTSVPRFEAVGSPDLRGAHSTRPGDTALARAPDSFQNPNMPCVKPERVCHWVGLGLMFGALGCGGQAADDSGPAEPLYSAPRATPTPPSASRPQRPQPAPLTQPEPAPPRARPQPAVDPVDLSRAAVENVLGANCGQCHGPALTRTQAPDGINFINDIDALVRAGLIVPLSSATSRIIVVMIEGNMPPPESGLAAVTEADIELVASYIDNPRFWADFAPPGVVDAGNETALFDAGPDAG